MRSGAVGAADRVVLLSPHFVEYTLLFGQALSRHAEVTALVDRGQYEQEIGDRDVAPGLDVLRVGFASPGDVVEVVRAVSRIRPGTVHMQEAAGPRRGAILLLVALASFGRWRVVLTVHDPAPHSGADSGAARRAAATRWLLRRLAGVIVVHGESCRRDYVACSPPLASQQVLVADHGVILSPPTATPPRLDRLRLLVFGRMEAYKGLAVMLDAAEALEAEGVDHALVIAGRGPELDRLAERFSRLGNVTIRNEFVSSDDLISLIEECECVVLPYLDASQSGVLAAALAGGRYVIASDVGGLSDVVDHGDNGLLVQPGDASELADAVRRLSTDLDLRERMSRGAAATAATRLSWDRIADLVAPSYRWPAPTPRGRIGSRSPSSARR